MFNTTNIHKIGIIGLGFVGSAINEALKSGLSEIICMDPAKGINALYTEMIDCDGVFVCVPSPMDDDGSCDTSILEIVLQNLKNVNYQGVIISKCTAPPLVYKKLQQYYTNLVHSPEFLTEANSVLDYANGKFSFIGGAVTAYRHEAERIIRISQHELKSIIHCTIEEAALAKYTINSFMATKVVFMNEIYELANSLGCNYELVAKMITIDTRIGNSHTMVPGPDGSFGFGGACFPKDTSALLNIAQEVGIDLQVLEAAVKKNLVLRLTESK